MRLTLRTLGIGLPLILAPLAGAGAAPQVLALVASKGPVPLVCRNGECAAEFSAFCLRERRRSPVPGTIYHAVGGEGIRITAVTADGSTVTLPEDVGLRIATARTHAAVRLSVPVAALLAKGLTRVAVAVGRGVSLVPEAVPGDPMPQSAQDLTIATGTLRALGSRIVDEGGDRVAAARLTNRLINVLPERGRARRDVRDSLWNRVIGEPAPWQGSGGPALARGAYEDCRARTDGGFMTLRECLGSAHDHLIGRLNNEYWDATKLGS